MSGKQILAKKKCDSFCLPLRKRQEVLSMVFKQNTYNSLQVRRVLTNIQGATQRKFLCLKSLGRGWGVALFVSCLYQATT